MFKLIRIYLDFKSKLKSLFVNKQVQDDIILTEMREVLNSINYSEEIDYNRIPSAEVTIINKKLPYLLILDDIPETISLYSTDFRNINRLYNYNVEEEFNTVKCLGVKAGLTAHKYLELEDGYVDYAILDITLGYIIKFKNGDFEEFDGIDIAIKILEKNPKAKIIFSTAHTMNRRNPDIIRYINKFESATGKDINNYYINKNSDRVTGFYTFFKSEPVKRKRTSKPKVQEI